MSSVEQRLATGDDDSFTPELAQSVTVASRDFFERECPPLPLYPGQDLEALSEEHAEDTELFVERELAFTRNVLGGLAAMAARREGSLVLLFDVDDSIAKNRFDRDGNPKDTVIRPSFPLLMQTISQQYPDRVEVGLLTSRAQSHVDAEMASPTYLDSAQSLLNPEFGISSRDGTAVSSEEATMLTQWSTFEDRYAAVESLLDPAKVSAEQEPYWDWFDAKLLALDALAKQYPDRGFMVVDDYQFTTAIDPNHPQVHGVRVGEESFFSLR